MPRVPRIETARDPTSTRAKKDGKQDVPRIEAARERRRTRAKKDRKQDTEKGRDPRR